VTTFDAGDAFDRRSINVDREIKRVERPYLVSALVSTSTTSGHRVCVILAVSEAEAMGVIIMETQKAEPTRRIDSIDATPFPKQLIAQIKALDISQWED